MTYVITLAAATIEEFPVEAAEAARDALASLGADPPRPHWLGPAACDLRWDGGPQLAEAEATVRAALGEARIDVIAQDAESRRKRLLVADMESTLIEQEMLDELAELKGIREQIAAVTARAMNGEIDFKEALRARVALLAGLPVSALHDLWQKKTLMPGAKLLVATMRRDGARTVLVSGGFTIFTAKLREELRMDADHGNELEFERGALTGSLVPPLRDKTDKLTVLEAERTGLGLAAEAVLSVGDGANDLPMLLAAGLGVAFRAKPSVRQAARFRIDHADLTALLYAQGYRREQFVSG